MGFENRGVARAHLIDKSHETASETSLEISLPLENEERNEMYEMHFKNKWNVWNELQVIFYFIKNKQELSLIDVSVVKRFKIFLQYGCHSYQENGIQL